ncbi:MAG TPA: DUF2946 domain-containing protein [Bradyrhizobium sp.]|jgi:hypothetical protein
MKWFRSNVRHGSRLALFALAIQALLSFGHFHGSNAQAAPALMDANQPGLHDTVTCAAMHLDASAGASHEDAFRAIGLKTSDHESDGRPTDDCAVCAVIALANALVVATPSYLPGPQPASSLYLMTDAEFIALNSARVVFRSRAPPIS